MSSRAFSGVLDPDPCDGTWLNSKFAPVLTFGHGINSAVDLPEWSRLLLTKVSSILSELVRSRMPAFSTRGGCVQCQWRRTLLHPP